MTITDFLHDDSGFIVSAELILIATIAVLGLIVGLSQVQNAVVAELNDVGHAIGALNQSYYFSGFHAYKWGGWTKSFFRGSAWFDFADACDGWGCMIVCEGAVAECGYWGMGVCGTGGAVCGSGTCGACGSCGAVCNP
jgi:Flp pilus assembly pilin Flp